MARLGPSALPAALALISAFLGGKVKNKSLLAPNAFREYLQSKSLIPRDELVLTSYL